MNPLLQNNRSLQPIDKNKFMQLAKNIPESELQRMVSYARQQGMSDEQIKQGLDFVHSLKNQR